VESWGIKPTLGLISRSGIIPIAHSQDTAGPMARTVADAAILLGALAGVDSRDTATESSNGKAHRDYTQFLDATGLRGARLGVARRLFQSRGMSSKVLENALNELKRSGATLVDFTDELSRYGGSEQEVLSYEFKTDLNAYLASLGPRAPMRTLADIIAFNEQNKEKEMPYFGQETFLRAQEKGPAHGQSLSRCVGEVPALVARRRHRCRDEQTPT
jgi:amidase